MRQTETRTFTKKATPMKQTTMGGETAQTTRKRFTVSSPREYTDAQGEVKTHWNFVGSAFESKNGINVVLDALPINGKLYINLNPETDRV